MARPSVLSAAILLVVLAFLTGGCGSNALSTSNGPGQITNIELKSRLPQALPVDQAQPWEQLDAQGRVLVPRTAASINAQTEFAPGIERYLSGGDVADLGEASRLTSGAAGARQLSFAMYRLSLGADQPGVVAADVNLHLQDGGPGLSSYYLGLSDYSRGRWEWHGPYTDHHVRVSTGAAVRAGAGYTSALGNLMLCVVAFDGAAVDVVGVGANRYSAADTTAPPVPTGLAATPVAGGLRLQWNAVLASDLAGYKIYWRQTAFTSPSDPLVVAVDYLEGATLHQLRLPSTNLYSTAVAAVDLSGNESAISTLVQATPLPGTPPVVELSLSAASTMRGLPVTVTATGATQYDFDLDGDGTLDTHNTSGLASVDTSSPGIIRPLVIGTDTGGTAVALGGVSLIVTGNTRPVASAIASPQSGQAPLSVTFTGTAEDTEDPPGALTYDWDFNGDGTYEAGTNTLTPPVYKYIHSGLYNASFRVMDSQGAWSAASVVVQVLPGGIDSSVAVSQDQSGIMQAIKVGGLMAIAYQNFADKDIYYVRAQRADATTWSAPVLVGTCDHDASSVTMTIIGGNPAVAWCDSWVGGIEYARASTPQGSAWNPESTALASGSMSGYFCQMVDAGGLPGLGYYNQGANRPEFIRSTSIGGSAWNSPVPVDAAAGSYCRTLLIDGFPAMAYKNGSTSEVFYTRATDAAGSAWGAHNSVAITTQVDGINLCSINGLPCISISDQASFTVWFVQSYNIIGSVWQPAIAAARREGSKMWPFSTALLEVDGKPVLVYNDGYRGEILLSQATDNAGGWWTLPVRLAPDTLGDTASGHLCLLDLNGILTVSYASFQSSPTVTKLCVSRYYQ